MKIATIEETLNEQPSNPPTPVLAGLLFRQTLAVLGAPEDSFKTTWAIQLAVSLAAGIPFLSYSCEPSRVAYIILEGGQDYILERLEEQVASMGVARDKVFGNVALSDCSGMQLDNPNDFKAVTDGILAITPPPDVVILDPITYALSEDVRFSPNKTVMCRHLLQLAQALNGVILVIVHCRKDTRDNDSTDDFLGSGVIARAAATRIKLYRSGDTVNMYAKTRHAARPDDLQLYLSYPVLLVGSLDLKPKEECRAAVLDSLGKAGGQSMLGELVTQVAKLTKHNTKTVRAAIDSLAFEKKVIVGTMPKSARKVVKLPPVDVIHAS